MMSLGFSFELRHFRQPTTLSNLQLIVNNSVVFSKYFNHPDDWQNRTWVKLRLMWYPLIEDPLQPQLGIACDRYVDDTWKNQWTYVDNYNQWKDSEVNRVGFSMRERGSSTNPYWTYVDNTEIWKPKE